MERALAYSEVYEILNLIGKEYKDKIPTELLQIIYEDYRVMKALRDSKHPITIKNIGDLARLLNVAKQLTFSGGRNLFEEFISIPQVETVVRNMTARKPEEIQAIQDYDSSGWEPNETPLEQEHRQIEEFKKFNTNEIYTGTLSRIKGVLATGKQIQIKSEARSEEELTEKHKAILAMSKMLMRKKWIST